MILRWEGEILHRLAGFCSISFLTFSKSFQAEKGSRLQLRPVRLRRFHSRQLRPKHWAERSKFVVVAVAASAVEQFVAVVAGAGQD